LHLIDTALAERVIAWGPLSGQKLEDAIDLWIDRYDPGALRRNRIVARNRCVSFGAVDDQAGGGDVGTAVCHGCYRFGSAADGDRTFRLRRRSPHHRSASR
jgi:hypothetical protein